MSDADCSFARFFATPDEPSFVATSEHALAYVSWAHNSVGRVCIII